MGDSSIAGRGIDLVGLWARSLEFSSLFERFLFMHGGGKSTAMTGHGAARRAELRLAISMQDLLAAVESEMADSHGRKEIESAIRDIVARELDQFFKR